MSPENVIKHELTEAANEPGETQEVEQGQPVLTGKTGINIKA